MKCYYCQKEIPKGTGILYVKKNGNTIYFCSNRCYRLAIIQNRKPKRKGEE